MLPLDDQRIQRNITSWRLCLVSKPTGRSTATSGGTGEHLTTKHDAMYDRVSFFWKGQRFRKASDPKRWAMREIQLTKVCATQRRPRPANWVDYQKSLHQSGGSTADSDVCSARDMYNIRLHRSVESVLLATLGDQRIFAPPLLLNPLTPEEPSRAQVETIAHSVGATAACGHLFASLVWTTSELLIQRMSIRSISSLSMFLSSALHHSGGGGGNQKVNYFSTAELAEPADPPVRSFAVAFHQLSPVTQKTFLALQTAWIRRRTQTASHRFPCGVPSAVLTTDREFLTEMEEFEPFCARGTAQSLHPMGLPTLHKEADGSSLRLLEDITSLFARYDSMLLLDGWTCLVDWLSFSRAEMSPSTYRGNESMTALVATLRKMIAFRRSGGELSSYSNDDVSSGFVPTNPFFLPPSASASTVRRWDTTVATFSDAADALCVTGAPLLFPPGASNFPPILGNKIVTSKFFKELMLGFVERLCPAEWIVLKRDGCVQLAVHKTAVGGLQLVATHTDGQVMNFGGPSKFDDRARKRQTTGGLPGGNGSSSGDDAGASIAENWDASGAAMDSCCPSIEQVERFLVAMASIIVKVSKHTKEPPVPFGCPDPNTRRRNPSLPPLFALQRNVLLPCPMSAVGALTSVLQSHEDFRYIAGCGARSFYVQQDRKLFLERVCGSVVEWSHTKSYCMNPRSERVELRPPTSIAISEHRHALPPKVKHSQVSLKRVGSMLQYYRRQLQIGSHPAMHSDGVMYVHEADGEILKYVAKHQAHYFARRGCGLERFFVVEESINETTVRMPPHEARSPGTEVEIVDDGDDDNLMRLRSRTHCYAKRFCGTEVELYLSDAYDTDGILNLPETIVTVKAVKRERR